MTDQTLETKALPPSPDWLALMATLVVGGVCALLVYRAPFLGHDWIVAFAPEIIDYQYPPWVTLFLRPLTGLPPRVGLAVLNGLTLSSVAVLSYRYARHSFPGTYQPAILAVIFALLNPIPWMLLWLGQIEVLVTLGLIILPVGVPLLFAKPNLGPWAALGSRRDVLWMMAMLLASVLIWGLWPRSVLDHAFAHRVFHPIAMGWHTIHPMIGVVGIVLLSLTSRDPLQLMAAGSLVSPFMMPYHYYVLLPALGRTRGYRQLSLWLASWMMLAVAAFRIIPVKVVALAFPLLVWVFLAPDLRPGALLANPDALVNRIRAVLQSTWRRIADATKVQAG